MYTVIHIKDFGSIVVLSLKTIEVGTTKTKNYPQPNCTNLGTQHNITLQKFYSAWFICAFAAFANLRNIYHLIIIIIIITTTYKQNDHTLCRLVG